MNNAQYALTGLSIVIVLEAVTSVVGATYISLALQISFVHKAQVRIAVFSKFTPICRLT